MASKTLNLIIGSIVATTIGFGIGNYTGYRSGQNHGFEKGFETAKELSSSIISCAKYNILQNEKQETREFYHCIRQNKTFAIERHNSAAKAYSNSWNKMDEAYNQINWLDASKENIYK